jgi:hypothetical protein
VNRLSDITNYIPSIGAEFISDKEGTAKSHGTLNFTRPFRKAPEGLYCINPIHILTEYSIRFHFNIIIKHTSMSAEQLFQIKLFLKITCIYIYIYRL